MIPPFLSLSGPTPTSSAISAMNSLVSLCGTKRGKSATNCHNNKGRENLKEEKEMRQAKGRKKQANQEEEEEEEEEEEGGEGGGGDYYMI